MKKIFLLGGMLLCCLLSAQAQSRKVKGKVLDAETQKPLPSASVSVVGNATTVKTDSSGLFTIDLTDPAILIVSYVGYQSQTLNLTPQQNNLVIALKESASGMDEVVVIGYGSQRRKDVTSAISSISGDELREMPVTNLNAAMQSRIPGMQVTNGGHQPGAGTNVRIRGINAIAGGNGPLYVIDGVITTGDIREINPNDVASIDVLKDASAAAIYGSRASEGVVLITTKKATAGRASVSYDGYYGLQQLIKGYDFVDDIDQYVHLRRLGWNDVDPAAYPIGDPATDAMIFNSIELESIANRKWYDWEKAITRLAPQQSHTLSLSNGVGKNRVYLSGNYLNQDGILKGSNFTRYSMKANVESEVNAKLKVGVNTNYSHIDNKIISNETYYNAITMSPLMRIFDEEGNPTVNFDPLQANTIMNNPVELTDFPIHKVDDRFIGSAYGEYAILKQLRFRTSFGLDIYKNQQFEYYPRTTSQGFQKQGLARVQNFGYRDYLWENTLTYDYNPSANHSFNFLAGYTFQKRRQEWNYEEASGFPTDALTYKNMGLASRRDGIASDYFNWSVESMLARVIYKLKDRYILNATARRDGSSRFGASNRYGFFPSVSGAWRIIDEPFVGLKTKTWLNDAKVRMSYGLVGNQNISYDYIFMKMIPALYPFNGQTQTSGFQVEPGLLGNPELQWESQHQFNAGFDVAVLQSRIRATFDYYNKDIRNMLLNVRQPPSMGTYQQWINIAEMNTRGIDLGLKAHVVKTKNFDWQMDVNWSKYVSKVTALRPGKDSLSPSLKVGEAPNSLLINYQYEGLYQEGDDFTLNPNGKPGDVKIADLDKNGVINQYDRTIAGRTIPKGWGGFWNYFRYKNMSLTVFANYMYGHDISNRAYQDYLYPTNVSRRILKDGLNYWTPENTNTNVPRPNVYGTSVATLQDGTSSFIVQKGDFVRVRNITFSYDFGQQVVTKLKATGLRMYVQVLEPFLFTGYNGIDPEISAGGYDVYPRARTFLFGVQLGL